MPIRHELSKVALRNLPDSDGVTENHLLSGSQLQHRYLSAEAFAGVSAGEEETDPATPIPTPRAARAGTPLGRPFYTTEAGVPC